MSSIYSFLIKKIKEKPQLNHLPEEFIEKHLNSYFLRRGDIKKLIEKQELNPKNKIIKEVVKEIRKNIGETYGSYQTSQYKRKQRYLKEENIEELLKCHKSTRERLNYYNKIYNSILCWYTPMAIADIASGFNPISYPFFEELSGKSYFYFACDLNPEDMNFINSFFEVYGLNGDAVAMDVTKKEFLQNTNFQKCDLVFLLKALDSFESDKKNSSKELLQQLPQKKIVVSFPTQSLVAKKEVSPLKRNWFVKFLEEMQWNYEEFEVENEMFFLIEKTSSNP